MPDQPQPRTNPPAAPDQAYNQPEPNAPNQPWNANYLDDHQPPLRVVSQPEPEKLLYEWRSPSRPYKKRSKEFYSTIAAIIVLLAIILVFANEFLLLGVTLSLAFLAYVLASVKPDTVAHALTNKGIRTGKRLYRYGELGRFWWDSKWKQQFAQVETPLQFPGQITLLLGEGEVDKIEDILTRYLIKEKPEPTWADRAADWLQKKVPLEADDD